MPGIAIGVSPAFTNRAPAGAPAAPPWWQVTGRTCVAAYQPLGAANLAASYTNLANPGTYTATPNVTPTWTTSTGWEGDGTTYLDTGIVPVNNQTWSVIARFTRATAHSQSLVNCILNGGGFPEFGLKPHYTPNDQYNSGGLYNAAESTEAGVMAVAGNAAYLNGSAVGTIYPAEGTFTAGIRILNRAVFGDQGSTAILQALAIYSNTLTAAEVAAVSAAIAAL